MKLKKIKFGKVKIPFGKLPMFLAKRAFLTFLGLLIIFLIFSAFLFYKYIYLVEKSQPDVPESALRLDENLSKEILKNIEKREKNFEETNLKQYPNPFKQTVPVSGAPLEGELTP